MKQKNNSNYGINDIESLSFKDGVRKRIAMYLGSADMQGVYNAIQEIISNSIDEYYMGYGNKIEIGLGPNNMIVVSDKGRGIPFGIKDDGTNVLVDIFSRPHTGGKFNDKVYNSVAGLNGIGAKATCLSSLRFNVSVVRDGRHAMASWEKGNLIGYKEEDWPNKQEHGTSIQFAPDPEVYNLEPIVIDFNVLCEKCKNLSYLTKGLTFELKTDGKKVTYCAENGLLDLIKDNVSNPIHKTPVYFEMEDGQNKIELAMQWTRGNEKSFVFTNGLENIEGGTSLTGMKTAITTFMKKQFKGEFSGDIARTGLVYAVSCKTPNPSFANQTKTKINNPELRGLAQRATGQALNDFSIRRKSEFEQVLEFLIKERKAEAAAERARRQVLETTKEISNDKKKRIILADKLKDCKIHGENSGSVLAICEGDSALGALVQARPINNVALMPIRGKIISALKHEQEKILQNEEVKSIFSALGCGFFNNYSSSKLRYQYVAIAADQDPDGKNIGCLLITLFYYMCPQFIKEGRLLWMQMPLFVLKYKDKILYAFSDNEKNQLIKKYGSPKELSRKKGIGENTPDETKNAVFGEQKRWWQLCPNNHEDFIELIDMLMGKEVLERKEYIMRNVDFSMIGE